MGTHWVIWLTNPAKHSSIPGPNYVMVWFKILFKKPIDTKELLSMDDI
jgi:hypothetical protein